MALNETRIDVLRGARKGHVHSALEAVATLSELANAEKDPAHMVKLLQAQAKLAEQKRRLARLNAEHPAPPLTQLAATNHGSHKHE
jgi:hypothetical protein